MQNKLNKSFILIKPCGFTLIELIITLSIVSIIGGIITIPISSQEYRNLNRICKEFLADVRYAQRMSLIEGKTYGISLDERNQRYFCYYKENYEASLKRPLKPDVYFKNGYSIELEKPEKPELEYTPWGTISKGAQTIYILSQKYKAKLTITPATGRIRMFRIEER